MAAEHLWDEEDLGGGLNRALSLLEGWRTRVICAGFLLNKEEFSGP